MGVYLVTHSVFNAAKIGVGVHRRGSMRRVRQHQRRGWQVAAMWTGMAEPWMAFDVERRVIQAWRDEGLPAHLTFAEMPQYGWTETVQLDLIDPSVVGQTVEDHMAELGVAAIRNG